MSPAVTSTKKTGKIINKTGPKRDDSTRAATMATAISQTAKGQCGAARRRPVGCGILPHFLRDSPAGPTAQTNKR
jgi:hypothetical protein